MASAVALLLLASVDLLIPTLCAAENVPVVPQPAALKASPIQQLTLVPLTSDATQPDDDSNSGSDTQNPEDDCWCCCGHIQVSGVSVYLTSFIATEQPIRIVLEPLLGNPELPYHPPRS